MKLKKIPITFLIYTTATAPFIVKEALNCCSLPHSILLYAAFVLNIILVIWITEPTLNFFLAKKEWYNRILVQTIFLFVTFIAWHELLPEFLLKEEVVFNHNLPAYGTALILAFILAFIFNITLPLY